MAPGQRFGCSNLPRRAIDDTRNALVDAVTISAPTAPHDMRQPRQGQRSGADRSNQQRV